MNFQDWQKQFQGYTETLLKITLAVLFSLVVFEVAKDRWAPDLTHWQSHAVTIIFGTVLVVASSYFFLRKQSVLYQQVLEENEHYKKSEEELRRTKEWFRSLTEHGSDLITVIDPQGTILYDSPSIERILGYRPLDRQGKNALDLVLPEDIPGVKSIIERAFQKLGSTHTIEMRVRGQDGRWHVLEATGKTMLDHEGKLRGVINSRDITERRRAEQEIVESREMLHMIVENIPLHVFWKDRECNYLGCNTLFAQSAGVKDPDAIIGKNDFELSWKKEAALYQTDDRSVMETNNPKLNFVEPLPRPDGSLLWLRTSKVPLHDREGRVFGMLGIFADITERKQVEEKLHLQTTALEATVNGIVITDHDGTIVWVNPAFTKLTGYSAEEALGQNTRLLKSDTPDPSFYANLWSTITSGRSWHGELINKRKDGTLYTEEQTITPVRNAQGEISHFIGIKRDITERKQMEMQAKQLSRLAALGQLIGGIAHELKNPLFILTGRTQMAQEKLAHQEYADLGSDLEIIGDVGHRMKTITDRFLAIAKPAPPEQKPCSIQAILHEALEFLANELMKGQIRVATAFPPDLPEIRSDPRQLHEVFLNLMLNAMKAMVRAHGKGILSISTAREENWIAVRIQDDGPGIAPEHRARLFEPFFSTVMQGQGTGLGLWIVRSTLMMLKGEVACESEVGKGTTFTVRLPVNAEESKP